MSNIEPLPGKHWSVKAAIVDMLDNVDDVKGFVILWTDENNTQFSQSGQLTNKDVLWMLELEKKRVMADE